MSLAKALKYGLAAASGGLTGLATAAQKQDELENDMTKTSIVAMASRIDKVRAAAAKRYAEHRQNEKRIDAMHGNLVDADNTLLTRNDVGQLLASFGADAVQKFMVDGTSIEVLKHATSTLSKSQETEGLPDIFSATKEEKEEKEEERSDQSLSEVFNMSTGSADRVNKNIKAQLERMGYKLSEKVNTGDTVYADGQFRVMKKGETPKIEMVSVLNKKGEPLPAVNKITRVNSAGGFDISYLTMSGQPYTLPPEHDIVPVITFNPEEPANKLKTQYAATTFTKRDGTELENVLVFTNEFGTLLVNDPRVLGNGKPPRLLEDGEKVSGVFTPSDMQIPKSIHESATEAVKNLVTKSEYSDPRINNILQKTAMLQLVGTYESIYDIGGFTEAVYARSVTLPGRVAAFAQVEIAGLQEIFEKDSDTKKDRSSQLADASKFINGLGPLDRITDVAIQRKVLDLIFFRAAVAMLAADKDTRPSDKDIALRMQVFSANSSKEMLEKMKVNLERAEQALDLSTQQFAATPLSKYIAINRVEGAGDIRIVEFFVKGYPISQKMTLGEAIAAGYLTLDDLKGQE